MIRLVSGLALAIAAIAAILFLPLIALRIVAAAVAALATYEYVRIVGGSDRLAIAVVIACWITSGGWAGGDWVALVPLLTLVAVAAAVLFAGTGVQPAAAGALSILYIGMPLGMLVAVHALGGWQATLLLLGTVVVSDSAQYYTGRAFGRRPLAPTISPKKTIEGAIGGVVFGSLFMTAAGAYVLPVVSYPALAALGLVTVTLGIAGDLFESRLKRAAGVKDSSELIPGHGGVLDRIDALLFAVPPFYFYLRTIT